jgi:alpha-1,2-glucosyltransferase
VSFQTYRQSRGLLSAFTMAFFPVLYFFTFLYYTDAGSTFFVLLAYLLGLRGRHVTAAMAGACAIIFRQTNVVWVAFVGASSACNVLVGIMLPANSTDKNDYAFINAVFRWFYNAIKHERRSLIHAVRSIFRTTWPYVIVIIGFLLFVLINGSIVVGAKQDHGAGFHVPQLFYFLGFTVAFSAVHFISVETVRSFINFSRRKFLLVCILFILTVVSVWRFTYVHRYLVADNRHYTFYVWSRIIARHAAMRYVLVPAYLFSAFAVLNVVALKRNILWRMVFVCCWSFDILLFLI